MSTLQPLCQRLGALQDDQIAMGLVREGLVIALIPVRPVFTRDKTAVGQGVAIVFRKRYGNVKATQFIPFGLRIEWVGEPANGNGTPARIVKRDRRAHGAFTARLRALG